MLDGEGSFVVVIFDLDRSCDVAEGGLVGSGTNGTSIGISNGMVSAHEYKQRHG